MSSDVYESNSYKAYHDYNFSKYKYALKYLDEKYPGWLRMNPDEMDLSLDECRLVSTVFSLGYDMIHVRDREIRPLIEDSKESYEIKVKWHTFLNKYISDHMGPENYMIFKSFYDSAEKEHWSGNETWRLLSAGSNYGMLIMTALKHLVWYKHMEGKPINFTNFTILKDVMSVSSSGVMYWTFDKRIKVVYDEKTPYSEIMDHLTTDGKLHKKFMEHVCKQEWEKAYEMILPEIKE